MKNYINLAVFFILLNSCAAQSPVLDISTPNKDLVGVQGAYYKDLNSVLNGYDGTYLYINGTTSFKIKLQKNVMVNNGYNYEDLVVGEYQYIENGTEKVNTLNQLNSTSFDNNISGKRVLTGTVLGCTECTPSEKRLRLSFSDSTAPQSGEIDIRKTIVGNKDAIIVEIWWRRPLAIKEGSPMPKPPTLKAGKYVMIKQ